MKTLKLNQMLAKAVRTIHDPTLVAHMIKTIYQTLENDQICFQIDPKIPNEYK